ncbi:MAG: hypothetical protein NC206_04380 [Bacteroides sp.]|nr:hypothetical protein [Roseburia sp.]MCM1346301.1 hypothetical protein [Bacteroides sp.]MCM1420810.1 hypothetical protein [Bacteroides sp.]
MTPYAIFVIVLTIAYIIYYGYNISKDLYGKRNENQNTEEVFDIESMSDEVVATPVREVDGGFSFGDTVSDTQENVESAPESQPDKYDGMKSQMEDADVQSEGGMLEPDLTEWMMQNRQNPTDVFRKTKITETRETL